MNDFVGGDGHEDLLGMGDAESKRLGDIRYLFSIKHIPNKPLLSIAHRRSTGILPMRTQVLQLTCNRLSLHELERSMPR